MLALENAFLASLSAFKEILIKLSNFLVYDLNISQLYKDSDYHGMLNLQQLCSPRLWLTYILDTQKLGNAFSHKFLILSKVKINFYF